MNLTLEALRILDIIDRQGSFAAAAAALDKVPSALTYTVRKLEQDLDVLLFDRRGHRARLTAPGLELLTEGRHLLRAAHDLEQRVQRSASGWGVELRIVVDSIIPFDHVLPLIADFDREGAGTRLRFSTEVLSGVWESLLRGDADLAIGAAYEGPDLIRMSGGYQIRTLGDIEWVFAVAPHHPLAELSGALPAHLLQQYRAVAVADTGQASTRITAGLLNGQDTLTVPSLQAKLAAQLAGLGCGHLPRNLAAPYLASGALIEKVTSAPKPSGAAHYAWRSSVRTKSLKWFIERLAEPQMQAQLLK